MNPRLFKYYLQYLLKAENRRGIQSPFVGQLLNEVIYRKSNRKIYAEMQQAAQLLPDDGKTRFSDKINRLLFRLAQRLEPQTIAFTADISNVIRLYISEGAAKATLVQANAKAQCVVCDAASLWQDEGDSGLANALQPGDMLIVTRLYHNPAAIAAWQRVQQSSIVTVTINLFEFGLVFCRAQQSKEDFTLRF